MADIKTQPPASFAVVQSNPQARSKHRACHPLHSYPSPPLLLPLPAAAAASCRRLLLLLLLHNFRQSTSVCACLLVAAPVCVCALSSFRSLSLLLLPLSLLLSLCCCCCLLSLHLQRLRSRWLLGLLPLARLLVVSLCWFRRAQKQKANEQEEAAEEEQEVVWENGKETKAICKAKLKLKRGLSIDLCCRL